MRYQKKYSGKSWNVSVELEGVIKMDGVEVTTIGHLMKVGLKEEIKKVLDKVLHEEIKKREVADRRYGAINDPVYQKKLVREFMYRMNGKIDIETALTKIALKYGVNLEKLKELLKRDINYYQTWKK